MEIKIFAGKGGVGKSTSAVAYALNKAETSGVSLVDYDGGHSLKRVLGVGDNEFPANVLHSAKIRNLSLAVIDPLRFVPIINFKEGGGEIQGYLNQFKGDEGLIPFCDMINAFFGAPTDISSVSKFASLIKVYYQALEQTREQLILDVEPTAGLERLLSSSDSIARSIQNLQRMGWATLKILGAKWPDIAEYLRGEYITNADRYTERMTGVADALKDAGYLLVTVPERSPVDQLEDVEEIVSSYGGRVLGYVVNNVRGEVHESLQIQRVYDLAEGRPVIKVRHDVRLCDSNPALRRRALRETGRLFEVAIA